MRAELGGNVYLSEVTVLFLSSEMSTNKLLRVTQLDAVFLDREIEKILKQFLENATKFLPPGVVVPFEPEIHYILKLMILKYSVVENGATFGQKLMLIKYDNMTNTQKYMYLILSSLAYIKDRLEMWNPTSPINRFISFFDGFQKICALMNLAVFLRCGVKPTLIDRLVGLEQVYSATAKPRQFNNKYLTRELLWNGFIELLVFILPLINYHKLRRFVRNMNPFSYTVSIGAIGSRIYNSHTKCPNCNEVPFNPHHMGCAHIFCYVCLKANQMADSSYQCPICYFSGVVCEQINVK